MSVIDHLDLATKRIYLAAGVREYHPVQDIYREVRSLRRSNDSLRKFDMPVTASGNVPKGGGKYTPRYATFRHGWKVVPEDTSHTLAVIGEQITDDGGSGPAAIDLVPLSSTSKVAVQYEPPAAEIIVSESANPSGDVSTLAGDSAAALKLQQGARRILIGAVDANSFPPSNSEFHSTLEFSLWGLLKRRILYWQTGALEHSITEIVDYRKMGGRGHFSVSTMPGIPQHGDTFLIV